MLSTYFKGGAKEAPSFESILIVSENENKKETLVLGLVKENAQLYFVVRKRHPNWEVDISLDRLPLADAWGPIKDRYGTSLGDETLRVAFERFVKISPFSGYIRENINAWATGQFFKKLRAVHNKII